jgi:4-hydroxy-3-polyprenylbenzoate decarboxylase
MTTPDGLSEYLARLTVGREIVRIATEVSPVDEIAAVTRRVTAGAEAGGPVLVFERVAGSKLPVVTNLWGTAGRVYGFLGEESATALVERLRSELSGKVAEGWWEKLRTVPQLAQGGRFAPRVTRSGACQQVVRLGRDVELGSLPFVRSGSRETAACLTSGVVFTKDPASGVRDVARVAVAVHERTSCRLLWSIHDVGFQNYLGYQRRSLRMPVAIVVGGDAAVLLAASLPGLPGVEPLRVAGFLRGGSVDLVACRSQDLEVTANAEVVLEGFIDPGEAWEPVGTVASATGHYRTEGLAPIVHVTAVTQRANPVWLASIAGGANREERALAEVASRLGLPVVQRLLPEVVDFAVPPCGSPNNVAFVGIRKQYPYQARRVIQQLMGLSPHWAVKLIVVVDEGVALRDSESVWREVAANVHAPRDLVQQVGPGSQLDHASPEPGMTAMVGLDATRKLPGEGHARVWPDAVECDADVLERLEQRWPELGLN